MENAGGLLASSSGSTTTTITCAEYLCITRKKSSDAWLGKSSGIRPMQRWSCWYGKGRFFFFTLFFPPFLLFFLFCFPLSPFVSPYSFRPFCFGGIAS